MRKKNNFRFRPILLRSILGGAGIILFLVIVCLALGLGATRTFLIDATARGIDVTFEGQTNYWGLGPVIRCTPLQKVNWGAAPGDGVCDKRRYSEQREDLSIEWVDGASVAVEGSDRSHFVLTISDQNGMLDGTRVIVAHDNWSMIGALSFVGNATLGRPAGSGETRLLLEGTYQVREKPFGSRHTETIKSNSVRKGESVTLVRQDKGTSKLATVYGYFTPNIDHLDALDIGIVSQAGEIAMSTRFFGGERPTEVAPNWIDRTLSSPLVLALTFVLSIGIGVAQLSFETHSRGGAQLLLKSTVYRNRHRSIRGRYRNRRMR